MAGCNVLEYLDAVDTQFFKAKLAAAAMAYSQRCIITCIAHELLGTSLCMHTLLGCIYICVHCLCLCISALLLWQLADPKPTNCTFKHPVAFSHLCTELLHCFVLNFTFPCMYACKYCTFMHALNYNVCCNWCSYILSSTQKTAQCTFLSNVLSVFVLIKTIKVSQ